MSEPVPTEVDAAEPASDPSTVALPGVERLSMLAEPARAEAKRAARLRLAVVAVVIVVVFLVGWQLGLAEYFDRERLRTLVEGLGAWGPVAFVVLFAVGELVHVPAWVFIGVAVVIWGPVVGGALGFLGANVSVIFSFALVRGIGGKAFDGIDRPIVKRLLARLDDRPITVVVALRILLVALPALNYGLALTRIRFRDYAIGSALGLVIPCTLLTIAFWLGIG
jgi:uncharacterized membrane protein YdjX (TVP38/TMEM64 family)